MELRDRTANLAIFGAAIVAWLVVAAVVLTRDPLEDPSAGFVGAALMGLAVGLTTVPLFWLAAFAKPLFGAIVVSQRVGSIKPHPAIFRAAEVALGLDEGDGPSILHVGDDWAADVVGAKGAGEIERLDQLEAALVS